MSKEQIQSLMHGFNAKRRVHREQPTVGTFKLQVHCQRMNDTHIVDVRTTEGMHSLISYDVSDGKVSVK